jgi:hypothetical protein
MFYRLLLGNPSVLISCITATLLAWNQSAQVWIALFLVVAVFILLLDTGNSSRNRYKAPPVSHSTSKSKRNEFGFKELSAGHNPVVEYVQTIEIAVLSS